MSNQQMPCCAHSRIDYSHEPAGQGKNLAGNPIDLVRDCWKCRDCGTEFVPAPWVQLEVSRATKELQGEIGDLRDSYGSLKLQRQSAESQVVALQEQVKALREVLDTAKVVLIDSDDGSGRGGFTFSERRYRALHKIDAALSQVPVQKEQDNG